MISKKKMATYTYKISPASVKRAKKKGNKLHILTRLAQRVLRGLRRKAIKTSKG